MWNRWDAFAAREPHFAVLTAPRFLQANLTPEREREFFASGETTVSWMLRVIDAALIPEFAPMTVLEYGCGIGRLALPLARRPGSITAIDNSPSMLARARQAAPREEERRAPATRAHRVRDTRDAILGAAQLRSCRLLSRAAADAAARGG